MIRMKQTILFSMIACIRVSFLDGTYFLFDSNLSCRNVFNGMVHTGTTRILCFKSNLLSRRNGRPITLA